MISVISPFYNEDAILRGSVELMLSNLSTLGEDWEFIIVNDGSTDQSHTIAEQLVAEHEERLQLISYPINKGRGHALYEGIQAAKGDIIITTEIDSSWGDSIVAQLAAFLTERPEIAAVFASPHLPGGGYKNVPAIRVFLSTWGNWFIRVFMDRRITMYTGMTRGYRSEVIKNLPVMEPGKEFHLEVAMKLLALGNATAEIPCQLEWRHDKLQKNKSAPASRSSSSNLVKLILTHLFFGITARPIRYLWAAGLLCLLFGLGMVTVSLIRISLGTVGVFFGLSGGLFLILATMFLLFGVMASQNSLIQQDLWRLQLKLNELRRIMDTNEKD